MVEIYNLQGVLKKSSTEEYIYIADLGKGMYITLIKNARGDKSVSQKLIIK